jgi:hypothetical protein
MFLTIVLYHIRLDFIIETAVSNRVTSTMSNTSQISTIEESFEKNSYTDSTQIKETFRSFK